MIRLTLASAILVLLLTAGCRPRNLEEEAGAEPEPPPAAALAAAADTIALERQLARLDGLLAAALRASDEDELGRRVFQAEAMSDRLLETRLPFEQLESGYLVQTRVRQLQALADRVVARIRRDDAASVIRDDLQLLQASVRQFQTELRRPGTAARPSLDSLLRLGPEAERRAAVQPRSDQQPARTEPETPRLLGAPLGPDTTRLY